MFPRALLLLHAILICAGAALPVITQAFSIRQDFWDYTSAEFGDGRAMTAFDADNRTGPPPKTSGWVQYDFDVPQDGWYNLYFEQWGGLTHELYVDGVRIYYGGIVGNPGEAIPREEGRVKAANLPLEAGSHTLRLQRLGRVGFPGGFPAAWFLKSADHDPADTICARIVGFDVVRKGESFSISITAGRPQIADSYDLLATDLISGETDLLATVQIPASPSFTTQTVQVPAIREGVFRLQARVDGRILQPAEFRGGDLCVIDTTAAPKPGSEQRTLIYDIDCIAQTLNGQPMPEGLFVEANGPTEVVQSPLGTYRESSDGLGPEATPYTVSHEFSKAFAGFSYTLRLPDTQSTWLLEVDYPDDNWRHITFPITDYSDPGKDGKAEGFVPPGGGVICGGIFPLTHQMQTYRSVFWASYPNINVAVVSQKLGARAAASRIRIFRFDAPLPPLAPNRPDGRIYLSWHEQADDWDMTANLNSQRNKQPDILLDYLGLSRWAAVAAYNGMNGLGPSDISYQHCFYNSRELPGFLPREYDMVRITALLCEKYGMAYIPNTFITQIYFEMVAMDRLADNADHLRSWSWQGLRGGTDVQWMTRNILHPAVQQKMIDIWGELADKLRDSPAFKGIAARSISWLWEGHWAISSIYWGYGDWTVDLFSRETGIVVPGDPESPDRFETRFHFLTASPIRERWLAWRSEKLTDFYTRLRDRIRGNDRPDLTVYLMGTEAVDRTHLEEAQGDTTVERLHGMGLDLRALAELDGFALIPITNPGRGKCKSPLEEQARHDEVLDPDFKALAIGSQHALHFWPQYDEWGYPFPLDQLGVPPFTTGQRGRHYCGTSTAAGRFDLERLAAVLADTDATMLMDGSFRINHGDRQVRGPWIAEFKQLPRLPFTPLEEARDPIAVWYRECPDAFYFYAVNRERVPLTISLDFSAATTFQRLGTGENLTGQRVTLQLQPFELAAFRTANGIAITGAHTTIPEALITHVRHQLAFAQHAAAAITGNRAASVTEAERRDFLENLEHAWNASSAGHLWRARTALSMARMMRVHQALGQLPKGQVVTAFPNLLAEIETNWHQPAEPILAAAQLQKLLAPGSVTRLLPSQTFHPQWRYTDVLVADEGTLDIDLVLPCAGDYQLSLGHVAADPGPILVSIGGTRLPVAAQIRNPNEPEHTIFPKVTQPGGTVRLSLRSAAPFGIYALRLIPTLRPLDSSQWATIGPFQSFWPGGHATNPMVKQTFDKVYPPEVKLDLDASCINEYGTELRWLTVDRPIGDREERGPNFTIRAKSPFRDVCFATTTLISPEPRRLQLLLGTDWWADLYLNGKKVESDLAPATQAEIGAWFTTFKPRAVILDLQAGPNTLLVKNLGGSLGSSFAVWIVDQHDLTIVPAPKLARR